ncbi:MAG TPA: acyltransferase [Phycisphaerae bacterium]|nr:acyltransferase [Phycisphaerae bacterium]
MTLASTASTRDFAVALGDRSPAPDLRPRGHLPALDGLRGIAISCVLLYHYLPMLGTQFPIIRECLGLMHSGWFGVDLFFVLSGFLITGILCDTKSDPRYFRTFYARRTLRIFPLYYAVLAANLLIAPRFLTPAPDLTSALEHQASLWTYTSNIQQGLAANWTFNTHTLALGHFWSLAIEEQFYLFWPAVIFFLTRRQAIGASVAILLLAPAIRFWMDWHGAPALSIYLLSWCRADSLAAGALAALLARGQCGLSPLQRPAILTLIITAIPLALIFFPTRELNEASPPVYTLGFSLLASFFAALILRLLTFAPTQRPYRFLTSRPLTMLGKYSYGLYVFHLVLIPIYHHYFGVPILRSHLHSYTLSLLVFAALASACSLAAAKISWHLLEAPCLSLKRFFPYVRPASPGTASPAALGVQSQTQ